MLSAPQTPLKQRVDSPALHEPPPGIGIPVLACASHMCEVVLHHWVEVQSGSALQPAAGRQVPVDEQAPLRQTSAAFSVVQGPESFA